MCDIPKIGSVWQHYNGNEYRNLDKTYCASSGTCARQSCPHWLDWHDVPKDVHVSLADLKDHLGYCPGYVENPVVSRIRWIVGA